MTTMSDSDVALSQVYPQSYTPYLWIYNPPLVMEARVNQVGFTYPLAEVAFDSVTVGDWSDIKPDMTVIFIDPATGDNLGSQRVRRQPTSDTLYIGWSSQGRTRPGEVDLADNVIIRVYYDWQPYPRTPRILDDGTVYRDYDLIFQYPTPPKPNAGPDYIRHVDPNTGLITVTFDATPTLANELTDSSSITTYSWLVKDGTIISGSVSSPTITVTFPPGSRFVELLTIDNHGQNRLREIQVVAIDPILFPCITSFAPISQKANPDGQTMSFKIFEDVDLSGFPYNAKVFYWEEETIAGQSVSLAEPAERGHV